MSNHRQKQPLQLTTAEYKEYELLQEKMKSATTPGMVRLYSQEIQRLLLEVQARQRKNKKSFITLATNDSKESMRISVDEYNEIERLKQEMEFAETPWQVRRYAREIHRLLRETKAQQRKDEEQKT